MLRAFETGLLELKILLKYSEITGISTRLDLKYRMGEFFFLYGSEKKIYVYVNLIARVRPMNIESCCFI